MQEASHDLRGIETNEELAVSTGVATVGFHGHRQVSNCTSAFVSRAIA